MQKNDLKKFGELMMAMGEVFVSNITPLKTEIYFKALQDIDIENIARAVSHIIQNRITASFPKPGEIRENLAGSSEDKALLALNKVEDAIKSYGPGYTVIFDDPVIHVTIVSMGGWEHINKLTSHEWKFARKDFLQSYKAFSKNIQNMEVPKQLDGYLDRTNETMGYADAKKYVAFIGDKKKALSWQGDIKIMEVG